MCEIAILKTNRVDQETMAQAAIDLYQTQGTALGIVAVQVNNNEFNYEIYRSTTPMWQEVSEFMTDTWANTSRYILHGRLATSGEQGNQGTHPIAIDCPKCDIDYILHNGVIGDISMEREQMESWGHEFTTAVDTELIAHEFGEVPEDAEYPKELLDEHFYLRRQPAFILLNSQRIYIHTRPRSPYTLTRDGELFCGYRQFGLRANSPVCHFTLRAPGQPTEVPA